MPTVRFGSTRGVSSHIKCPALEDITPYMDDKKGVYFRNTAKDGSPLEWAEQAAVSGMAIESVNIEILRLGRDTAFLWWLTGDKRYEEMACGVLDTYMTGMYYRSEPVDIGNGHARTLVGMSTFEVIQEGILHDLAAYYDFLLDYTLTIRTLPNAYATSPKTTPVKCAVRSRVQKVDRRDHQ